MNHTPLGPAPDDLPSLITDDVPELTAENIRLLNIGLDTYSDSRIRPLHYAARDARALHTLWHDTIPGIQHGQLLCNEDATAENIAHELGDKVHGAGENDIAIVSFSGHGTQQYEIPAHDLDLDSYQETLGPNEAPDGRFPMSEIYRLLHDSRARITLVLLDCCFSGHAASFDHVRLMENSPEMPAFLGSPLEMFEGEGGILVTACREDEVALERPDLQHGVLTHHFIEAMKATQEQILFLIMLGRIMQRTMDTSGEYGIMQTPTFYGRGSLIKLPPFRTDGERYREFLGK